MHLVVLHYHLLPGGVTGVIVEGTRALLHQMPEIDRITVVCGRQDNAEAVRGLVLGGSGDRLGPDRFSVEVEPLVDYLGRANPGDEAAIRRMLLERYCRNDAVLWVHNYQLGKNPALTRAVVAIAAERPRQRLILQIHDFPECARYENLARLEREVPGTLYPLRTNVRYALINSRDRSLLISAGIPERHAVLLENPVEVEESPPLRESALVRPEAAEVRERLFAAFGSRFPAAAPDAPVLLYPVRTIRRKNVLEAGFIAASADAPMNLFVTLPGVSVQERVYSQMVAETFRAGLIPGLWGFGREMEAIGLSFADVVTASDMVVSSSVQEGFGYQFINALTWGRPLLARYLDVLDAVTPIFDGHPHTLYRSVDVPLSSPSIRSLRPYLRLRYQEYLDRLGASLPDASITLLGEEVSALVSADTVDFSYLPAQVQYSLLKDLRDPGFRADIWALNSGLFESLGRLLRTPAPPLLERVRERYGAAAYVRAFRALLDSFEHDSLPAASAEDGASTAGAPDSRVRRNLVAAFSHLQNARLLFEELAPDDHSHPQVPG